MAWPKVTALVIVGIIVGLMLYDLVVYVRVGNDATISRVVLDVASRSAVFVVCFVFSLGVLVGHLFLPQTVRGKRADPPPDQEHV